MAVNPIQFLVAQNASITDGTKTITVSGNVDCSRVFSGTAVFLGGADNPAEAVSGTSPNGSGVSTITLRNNWSQGDIVNQQLVSFNTNEGLAEAISNVREIVSNVSAIEDLATQGLIKRISDNQYEVVNISAIGESLITANDASSQRSVLGLGSAATKDTIVGVTDVSSGKVLVSNISNGYFGLGGNSGVSWEDYDDFEIPNGFYNVPANATGTFPSPSDTSGQMLVFKRFGGVSAQIAQIYVPDNSPEIYWRNSYGGSWQEWQEIYHSGNTNFNEFGGNGVDDRIAKGICRGATTAFIELPLNSLTPATGFSAQGTFRLVNYAGTNTLVSGISSSDFSLTNTKPSNKLFTLLVTVSGGLTGAEPVFLETETASAKITVNF